MIFFKLVILIPFFLNYKYLILFFIKLVNKLKERTKKLKIKYIKDDEIIKFIKDGEEKIIYNLEKNQILLNKTNEYLFNINKINFDLIIKISKNNIKRLNNNLQDLHNSIQVTDKQFLSIKLYLNNKYYNINLLNPNYYVLNNKLLDKEFIKWYISKEYNLKISDMDDYHIILMDKEIKEYKLNKYHSIKITENGYNIETIIN